ncbi:MAG: SulP family inorganic anion transporter [Acutalibacteraceae bacterium]|nr:SulP family inorganic anion transporter [Acutalibacteraceae bacterium]
MNMVQKYIQDMKNEFSGYNLQKLAKDLTAGLTVCAVALPLALAFGVSGGATAAAGMVTAIVAGIVIGLLSGASFQISGPTGAMSAVLISIVMNYKLQGVFIACFLAGAILLLCGIFKLGKLISFIPSSVIMGFTSGIAITIAFGQIDNFFGTTSEGTGIIEKIISYTKIGFTPHLTTTLIAIAVLFIMVIWPKKWGAKVPASLIGIIVATAAQLIFNFEGVAVVGDIPKTLFLDERLSLNGVDFAMIKNLLSPVLTIAALGIIESLLCGASASRMKKEPFDADRELVAQGIGNMILPILGGVPATAAIARTSVAIKSGEQTRLTSIFHSVFLLASMFLLGDIMAKIPLSALAAVLMVTAFKMNEWEDIKYIFSHKFKTSISQFLLTMVCTVVFDLTVSIVLGILYSAIMYMSASAHISIHYSDVDPEKLSGKLECSENDFDGVQVAYVTGPLYFGSANEFEEKLNLIKKGNHTLLMSMRGVPTIDVSGARIILEKVKELQSENCEVMFCGMCKRSKIMLDRAGVTELVGEDNYYISADQAFIKIMETHKK